MPVRVLLFTVILVLGCSRTSDPSDGGSQRESQTDGGTTNTPDAGAFIPDAGITRPAQGLRQVTTRDGITLNTWLYSPEGTGPFPAFLVRNPYAGLNRAADLEQYAQYFTSRGMMLVWQATRGTGGSGGAFVPYLSEVDDAKDTINWLVSQPYCNGRIGVGGGSYLGYTAFAAAAADPHVVVIISDDTAADEEMTRHKGVVNGYLLSWWSLVERERLATDAERAALTNDLDVAAADEAVLGRDLPYWNQLLEAGTSVYPPQASLQVLAANICTPALHILEGDTAWNDPRLTWEAIGQRGCPQQRNHQWLVVAPETHAFHFGAWGLAETWLTADMLTMLQAFLLQSIPAPTWERVRYRVESDEPTRTATQWPPPTTRDTSYFLGPVQAGGEGTLTTTAPASSSWVMQSRPATTNPCSAPTATWFTSAPLAQDLVLAGAPRFMLTATTAAADFDVHVELYDYLAGPEEYRSLGTGSVRARYHTGVEVPLNNLQPFPMEVELTSSARRVRAGHAITVSVAPSRCEFAENPHTGEPVGHQTMRLDAQVDFALGAQGAHLVLPTLQD